MASNSTQRRSLVGPILRIVAVIALVTTPGYSWSHASYRGRLTQPALNCAATSSPLFVQSQQQTSSSLLLRRRRDTSKLFSSEKEESEDLEESTSASEAIKKVNTEDDDDEKFGVVKT
eukprot:scaffold2641_cov92-Amphora_coffeaeformis.AAC.1